jgi:hypothetical protein
VVVRIVEGVGEGSQSVEVAMDLVPFVVADSNSNDQTLDGLDFQDLSNQKKISSSAWSTHSEVEDVVALTVQHMGEGWGVDSGPDLGGTDECHSYRRRMAQDCIDLPELSLRKSTQGLRMPGSKGDGGQGQQ